MSKSLLALALLAIPVAPAIGCQTTRNAAGQAEPQQQPDKSAEPVILVPWIEVNTLATKRINHAVEGLLIWQKVTDTAIVSTRPDCAALYPELRRRLPGMRIIPGIKTHDRLPRFDSVAGWKALAREVRAVCASSGENWVVFENEGAIKGYWRQEYDIDPGQLRKALKQLPDDVNYIWYPGYMLTADSPETIRRAGLVADIVNEVCNARIVDLTFSSPSDVRRRARPSIQQRAAAIKKTLKRPEIPMLYCYGDRYWPDEQVLEAARYTDGGWVILYSGIEHWIGAAQAIAAQLATRVPSSNP
jgi:hypothetical protein